MEMGLGVSWFSCVREIVNWYWPLTFRFRSGARYKRRNLIVLNRLGVVNVCFIVASYFWKFM